MRVRESRMRATAAEQMTPCMGNEAVLRSARDEAFINVAVREGFERIAEELPDSKTGEEGVRDCTTSWIRVLGFAVRIMEGMRAERSEAAVALDSVPAVVVGNELGISYYLQQISHLEFRLEALQ